MGWAEVVVVALVIVIALLFLLNRAARPMAEANRSTRPAVRPAPDAATAQQIIDLVNQGKKIEAIKLVRERTGWGLAEAEAYVDRLD